MAVLALADVLFFGHVVGVSIVVFVVALFLASVVEARRSKVSVGPVVMLFLGVLPVVEYVQFFSVVFAITGLIVAIAWHRLGVAQSIDAVLYGAQRRFRLRLLKTCWLYKTTAPAFPKAIAAVCSMHSLQRGGIQVGRVWVGTSCPAFYRPTTRRFRWDRAKLVHGLRSDLM